MKQILTLVLVLATLGLGAQKVDTTKLILNGGYGYDYKIWKVDSSLILPGGNKDTSAKAPRQIKIIDTTIWYTGKDGIWRSIHPKGATVGGGASGITKLGLSPYALVKLNDSTYYADSTVLLPRTDSIPGGYYPWSNPLGFITSANLPTFKQNGVVSGGAVVWLHDYVYNVSASTYYIDGVFYASPSTDITLAPSTNLDRIDAFALTTSSIPVAITGTAASTPIEPTIDANTQLRISIALVSANTTQPVALTNNFIYKENLGQPAEWTTFSSGTSIIVLASTNSPYAGTKDIEGINVPNGVYALFTAPAGVTPSLYNALTFQIRSKATFGTTKKIVWRFYNSLNQPIGNPIPVGSGSYGFNSANTTTYQTVTIPIADFGNISGASALRATQTNSSGTIGWYLDNIQLQNAPAAGTNNGSVTTVTGTYPIVITGNPTTTPNVTVDTGRGPGQISTGGDLIKVRDSLSALITAGGNGTVTSVAKGFGIRQDGTITVAGTINADSTVLSTKSNVTNVANTINTRITSDSTFLKNLIDSKGSGTVTSVATNNGTGITGGTITTLGTLALDTTSTVSTKANVQKVNNILQNQINIVAASDSTAYHTATSINDTIIKLNRLNGTSTVLIVGGGGTTEGGGTTNQPITVTATGDATGTSTSSVTAPSLPLTLATVTTGATVGSSTQIPVITYDAKGRIISTTTATVSGGGGASGWLPSGNVVTYDDFLGSTNNMSFFLRTNNTKRAKLDSLGNFIYGTLPVLGKQVVIGINQNQTGDATKNGLFFNSSISTDFADSYSGIFGSDSSASPTGWNLSLGLAARKGLNFHVSGGINANKSFGFYNDDGPKALFYSGSPILANKYQDTWGGDALEVGGSIVAQRIGTPTRNVSSIITATSTVAGILPPRMTNTQRDLIASGITVTLTNAGSGYTSVPTVTFSAPASSGGEQATGTVGYAGGVLTGVTFTNNGSGYGTGMTGTITGGGGSGATITITVGIPEGLEIYSLTDHVKQFWNGTVWKSILTN